MTRQVAIATPHGEGRLLTHRARTPIATLLLSHGAGTGVGTPDLQALAEHLPRNGISVALFEQPWKVAGRPVASPPATLDAGLVAAARTMRARTPVVVGGRSAGARSAVRTARSLGATGALALAFPLHPPGKPERSRVGELEQAGLCTLLVQGERDPFGRPEEFPDLAHADLVVVPGGDHGFKVPKRGPLTQDQALDVIVESVLEWVVREVSGPSA